MIPETQSRIEEPRATSGCGGVGPSSGGGPNQCGGRLRGDCAAAAAAWSPSCDDAKSELQRHGLGAAAARCPSSSGGLCTQRRRRIPASHGAADLEKGEVTAADLEKGEAAAANSATVVARIAVDRVGVLERDDGAATAHGLSGDGGGSGSPMTVRREMVLQGVTIEMGLQGGRGEKMRRRFAVDRDLVVTANTMATVVAADFRRRCGGKWSLQGQGGEPPGLKITFRN
ncbi:hypothetical protein Syun_017700 [Stephania yunnanensis]|uniref:Uncharacterized protein n=1 Tax=Stephania yunnanensis TaxID=152371 RepID=A0AAP0P3A4_9MAGN